MTSSAPAPLVSEPSPTWLRGLRSYLATVAVGNLLWEGLQLPLLFGLAYAVFSEWLNVVVRASSTYSDWMPIVPIAGLRIGLSPCCSGSSCRPPPLPLLERRRSGSSREIDE